MYSLIDTNIFYIELRFTDFNKLLNVKYYLKFSQLHLIKLC